MKIFKVEIKLYSGDKLIYENMSEEVLNSLLDAKIKFVVDKENSTMIMTTSNPLESNLFFVMGDVSLVSFREVS